jgi:hypothetical protein
MLICKDACANRDITRSPVSRSLFERKHGERIVKADCVSVAVLFARYGLSAAPAEGESLIISLLSLLGAKQVGQIHG